METLSAKLFANANKAIQEARDEMQHENDLLAYTVCSKAYNASCLMLSAWLEEKGIQYNSGSSLPELVKLCRKHEPVFENFDFENFGCVKYHDNDNEDCRDDKNTVSGCFEMTVKLQDFLKKETVLGN